MADFGISISRFGIDVKSAADFQLILNSSWPSLKVHHGASVTFTSTGSAISIYTHSLGYTPCFQVFDDRTLGLDNGLGTRMDSSGFYCTSTDIFANIAAGTYTVFLYVYRQDLNTAYTAPNVNTVSIASGSVSADEGLKVSKIGKDISSTDLRDFAIHSGTQELGIAQVTPFTVAAGTKTITHNLGYKPAWLFFQGGVGGGGFFDATQMNLYNLVRTTADNNSITFTGSQAPLNGTYAAVIFKDPVLLV